jgi:hypothetical protein
MERETAQVKELDAFIGSVTIGKPETFRNLSVYPFFSSRSFQNGYVLVEDAISTGGLIIEEVSEGGSVPELRATNLFRDIDVLIFQGDQLIGAKQNRIVNTSIIVSRKSSLTIPVTCCEQNRWSYQSRRFSASKSPMYASLRRKSSESVLRSLRTGRTHANDQHAVWDSIQEKTERMNTSSRTSAMEDIYAQHDDRISEYETNFTTYPGQIGFAAEIDGDIVGCDIVGPKDVFGKVYRKILRGYILDALDADMTNGIAHRRQGSTSRGTAVVERFLDKTLSAKRESYKAVGEGKEIRFEDKGVNGFALLRDKNVVHMAVFA